MSDRHVSDVKMYAELVRKKKCAHCKKEKPIDEYYNRTVSPDGLGVYCKLCDNEKSTAYRVKFRDEVRAQRKSFRDANKEMIRFQKLKSKRGIGKEEWEKIFHSQNYRCAICEKKPEDHRRVFSLDHDHKSGKIRGILCDNCNRCLGLLKDDIEVLKRSILYLKKYKN